MISGEELLKQYIAPPLSYAQLSEKVQLSNMGLSTPLQKIAPPPPSAVFPKNVQLMNVGDASKESIPKLVEI